MMKLLIALSIVQTAIVGFVGLQAMKIDTLKNQLAAVTSGAPAAIAAQSQTAGEARSADRPLSPIVSSGLTPRKMREIIREEIAAAGGIQRSGLSGRPVRTKQPVAYDDAETVYLKSKLHQELDYLIGQGKINEVEMIGIQQKIAKLPVSERGAFLSKMTKAMNSGDLDARF